MVATVSPGPPKTPSPATPVILLDRLGRMVLKMRAAQPPPVERIFGQAAEDPRESA